MLLSFPTCLVKIVVVELISTNCMRERQPCTAHLNNNGSLKQDCVDTLTLISYPKYREELLNQNSSTNRFFLGILSKKQLPKSVNNSHPYERTRGESALSNGCHRKASLSCQRRHIFNQCIKVLNNPYNNDDSKINSLHRP